MGTDDKQKKSFLKRMNVTPTFWIALSAVLVIVIIALIFSEPFTNITRSVRDAIANSGGWFYLLTVLFLVFACFVLVVSPVGRIRLGDSDSKPEYSTVSWIAMLFAAGMGISLVFYGAAEPLSHYASSAPEAALYTQEALQNVLIITALPFSILLLLITVSLIKELNYERRKMGLFLKPQRHPEKNAPFRSYEDNK